MHLSFLGKKDVLSFVGFLLYLFLIVCAYLSDHINGTEANTLFHMFFPCPLVYSSNNFSEEFRTLWTKELLSLSYNKAEVISVKSNLYVY